MESDIQRKIIHVDMDCFYAAIEMRDNPELANKPLAVGGSPERRGVIATCNYLARKFGVHSAMASSQALRLCPELKIVKPQIEKYKQVSQRLRTIFYEYTDLVELLSLDEAFLDVSHCNACQGSATLIAQKIRKQIFDTENLTASAGIAPNKFLAKIASDWNKPNGQYVILPANVQSFLRNLPVKKLFGVGKVTEKKLADLGIKTCGELEQVEKSKLLVQFGNFGQRLFELARGIDEREVCKKRSRKSLSVEETFVKDLVNFSEVSQQIDHLYLRLEKRLGKLEDAGVIRQIFVKLKFHDFVQTTVDRVQPELSIALFKELAEQAYKRGNRAVRLVGLGTRFAAQEKSAEREQETKRQLALDFGERS